MTILYQTSCYIKDAGYIKDNATNIALIQKNIAAPQEHSSLWELRPLPLTFQI